MRASARLQLCHQAGRKRRRADAATLLVQLLLDCLGEARGGGTGGMVAGRALERGWGGGGWGCYCRRSRVPASASRHRYSLWAGASACTLLCAAARRLQRQRLRLGGPCLALRHGCDSGDPWGRGGEMRAASEAALPSLPAPLLLSALQLGGSRLSALMDLLRSR